VSRRVRTALVFLLALAVLMLAARTQGNTRDEGTYFDAAEFHAGYYGELVENLLAGHPQRSFTKGAVDRWFNYNHEHPGLMKTLFGLSWRLLHRCNCPTQAGLHPLRYAKKHRTLGLLSEEEALRLPTEVLVALMVALVYRLTGELWSERAGLLAASLALFAPRLFFDAELACFDAPIAAMWTWVVYAYFRALRERKWGWRAGAIFGLALATKHNAFFLPFVLAAHWLFTVRTDLFARRLPRAPRPLLWMALLGPVVYLACWPWLWFDTVHRFSEYVSFHVHHVFYNMEYLGRNYNKPPSPISFPYVMTLFTVPVTTLALAATGCGAALLSPRTEDRRVDAPLLLFGLNAVFPMAILTFTGAPIFGATKHWHASIPFLALLAGYGYHRIEVALSEQLPRGRAVATLLAALFGAPAALDTIRSHPYALTHYNALAGGAAGGADLGLNRQFWGYATRGLFPWINAHAPRNASIYWHDTNQLQLNMHVRSGRLRRDLRNTGLEEAGVKASNLALVIHEMHFNKYEYWIWDFYGTTRPMVVLTHDGVPIVTLYERPVTR
jgi:4-amino-4-deoxy-L-arabinose transferase-like glycosyltransferase